jgi:hypothetical protein
MAIKLPRWAIYGGAVVGAGGLWWLYKRHQANAASTSSSSSGSGSGSAYGPPLPGGGILGPIYSPVNITNSIPPAAPTTTPAPTPTPAPTTTGTPAPAKTPTAAVASPSQLESILDQLVGTLSKTTGKNMTPAQSTVINNYIKTHKLTGTNAAFYGQTQNVGYISQGMHVPTPAQITSLATSLAGGSKQYASLPSLQKNQYGEIANVELLQQMNK